MRRVTLLLFIAFALNVSLVSASFSVSQETTGMDVCRGATSVLATRVSGSGDFSVSTSGSAKPFTTTVPQTFSIESGQQNVYSYTTPPSSTSEGKYDLAIEVSDGSETKTVLYSLNVRDCHGSILTVEPPKRLSCPGDKTSYTLSIENLGEYGENFEFSVEGTGKEWVNLSAKQLFLSKGEKKTFDTKIDLPYNVYGLYDLTFKAKSTTSLASTSAKATLDIRPCYDYSLEFKEERYSACMGKETVVPLVLKNIGTANNTFKLAVSGASWASSENSVEIGAGSEKAIDVRLSPPKGLKDSDMSAILSVESLSDLGKVVKKTNTKGVVEDCYIISLDVPASNNICNFGKDYSYPFKIRNSGKEDEKVNLSIESPEWISLKSSKIKVGKGNETEASLEVQLPSKVEYGDYDVKIKALSENGAEASATTKIKLSSEEQCFSSSLESDLDKFQIGIEKGKTVTVTLKNGGLDRAVYTISLDGNASGFSLVNPGKAELEPGKEEKLYLYVSPPVLTPLGDYVLHLKAKVRNSNLEFSKDLSIKVVASDADTENPEADKSVKKDNIFSGLLKRITGFFANLFREEETQDQDLESSLLEEAREEANASPTPELEVEASGLESEITSESDQPSVEDGDIGSIIVGNTTINVINVDSLSAKDGLGGLGAESSFSKYKNHLISALAIIAVVLILASGLGKKIIDFFDDE